VFGLIFTPAFYVVYRRLAMRFEARRAEPAAPRAPAEQVVTCSCVRMIEEAPGFTISGGLEPLMQLRGLGQWVASVDCAAGWLTIQSRIR
jgi:hypothetical protein